MTRIIKSGGMQGLLFAVGVTVVNAAIPLYFQSATDAPHTPGATPASFDVATIKPSAPDARQGFAIQAGGRVIASSFTLRALIALAWHLTPFQMSGGGEGWVANDRWNIEALAGGVTSVPRWAAPNIPEAIAVRLRTLLEDRFVLKVHREIREQQVYLLTAAKTGSKLVRVPDPSQSGDPQPSGSPLKHPGSFRAGPGVVIGEAVTMDQIVGYLDRLMDRQVIDRTGLTGYYDMKLQFAPESAPRALSALPPANGSSVEPQVSAEPTLFTAMQEQLGLKLDITKERREVFVIDSARKPTEN